MGVPYILRIFCAGVRKILGYFVGRLQKTGDAKYPMTPEIHPLFAEIVERKTRECLYTAFFKTKLNGSDGLKR